MKKIVMYVLTLAMILSLVSPVLQAQANRTGVNQTKKTEVTPVLFVHGYGGGSGTFDTMISRYYGLKDKNQFCFDRPQYYPSTSSDGAVRKECNNANQTIQTGVPLGWINFDVYMPKQVKMTTKNGVNYVTAQIIYDDTNPVIQRHYLERTLNHIANTYSIKEIFIVSHSMGGLGSWTFITDSTQYSAYKVKLVTLGSPFSFIDLTTGIFGAKQYMKDQVATFKQTLDNYDVARQSHRVRLLSFTGKDDYVVEIDSGSYLCNKFQEKKLTLPLCQNVVVDAAHSFFPGIHQHAYTIDLTGQFLDSVWYNFDRFDVYVNDKRERFVHFDDYKAQSNLVYKTVFGYRSAIKLEIYDPKTNKKIKENFLTYNLHLFQFRGGMFVRETHMIR
jgi:uncharacterized alpha/beta hydrolase family protein